MTIKNPLKLLRILMKDKGCLCLGWMKEFYEKRRNFPGLITRLKWAVDFYYEYKSIKNDYNKLKQILKKYEHYKFVQTE